METVKTKIYILMRLSIWLFQVMNLLYQTRSYIFYIITINNKLKYIYNKYLYIYIELHYI